MSVITATKRFEDLLARLTVNEARPTAVLGCDRCAKVSRTGGQDEVRELRRRLRAAGVTVVEVQGLVDAVEEGMCDAKAVAERVVPLEGGETDLQLLVLSCGAGLKCLRDTLPTLRLVPGLDTLGPGVKGELACLSCGDCRFGEGGCAMLAVARRQSERLDVGYPRRA